MRPRLAAPLLLSVHGLTFAGAQTPQTPDASAILAAARVALGGDSALNSITSLTVGGSIEEAIGRITIARSVEISLQLPDKFVMMMRHSSDGPPGIGGFTVTNYKGFNGDVPLDAHFAPGAPVPIFIPAAPMPKTPAEIQAAAEGRLRLQKQAFARFVVPLFAASPAALPLRFESGGQIAVEKILADMIIAKTADGTDFRMYFDAATRLPLRLTWMDAPVVTFSTTSTVTMDSRGDVVSQTPPLGGPPPVGQLAPVEWSLAFSDFKTEAGLTWPHRFVTSYGGRKHEDMRLGKYKINVPIKPQVFQPRK